MDNIDKKYQIDKAKGNATKYDKGSIKYLVIL